MTADQTLRELPTPDGVLRYYETGDTGAPPLLLLHGSGPGVTGWRNFKDNLPTFARQFRCLVLEFPGFGVSDPTEQNPMVAALPAVTSFLDGLAVQRAAVIGNSMGGVVATRFAMDQPDRVSKLVTIGGVGQNLFSPGPGEGINLLIDFVEDPTKDRLRQWLHSMVYDPALVTEELIEERWAQATEPSTLAASRRQYTRQGMMAVFRPSTQTAAAAPAPYWTMLHKVRAETLLTWGRDDRVSPLDMALVPMRTIPNAELHVFPKCGHWVMIEQKRAWEAAVLAFLTRGQDIA